MKNIVKKIIRIKCREDLRLLVPAMVCFFCLRPYVILAQASISQEFHRPSRYDISAYDKIIIGQVIDEKSNYKQVFSGELPKIFEKVMAMQKKVIITDRSPDWPMVNYREIVQSGDSLINLGFSEPNALLITAMVNHSSMEMKLEKSITSRSQTGTSDFCREKWFYELSGSSELKIRFIDGGSGKVLAEDVIFTPVRFTTDSANCMAPNKPNDEFEVTVALQKNGEQFLKKIINRYQMREFEFLDDFFTDPFPGLHEISSQFSQKNERNNAMRRLMKYSHKPAGNRVKSKALYNYSIGLLCTFQYDSALLKIQEAITLRPGVNDYERLKEIIEQEQTFSSQIKEMNKKNQSKIASNLQADVIQIAPDKLPDIYAVVIGVADYSDPKINDLRFSENDCKAVYDFLKSPNGGRVPEKNLKILTSKQATRPNVIRAMNETFGRASENDLIMLFIACHGETDASGTEVYFLMSDTESENLEGTAVSDAEIQKIITKSRSQKKIIIADACHSGGIGLDAGKRSVGSAQMVNRLLFQQGHSKNLLAYMSASSNYETSQETKELGGGQGVFTYFLLEGLKGKADQNGNGLVTLREIQDFTYRMVADYTQGKQHPELKGYYSNSFPISVVNPGK